MKLFAILAILLIFLVGCSSNNDVPAPVENTTEENTTLSSVAGIEDLILNEQDLSQLAMQQSGNCNAETYETGEYSQLAQYSMCNYTIEGQEDTEVIIELKKFTNVNDLTGSYQYESSHLFSSDGIISRDAYGDMSVFRVNHPNDYGGEFNEEGMYYFHLWIGKDTYLIHITSGGSENVTEYIANIGKVVMEKFE